MNIGSPKARALQDLATRRASVARSIAQHQGILEGLERELLGLEDLEVLARQDVGLPDDLAVELEVDVEKGEAAEKPRPEE